MASYWMAFARDAKQCFDINKVRHGLPAGHWEPAAYWRGYIDGTPDERRCGGLSRLRWFLEQHPNDFISFGIDDGEPCSYDIKAAGNYVEQSNPWDER